MKRKPLLYGVAAIPAVALFLMGPDIGVAIRTPSDRENLHRLGTAVAAYRADHDGAYPLVVTDDIASTKRIGLGVTILRRNPLAPYTKRVDDLFSPATYLPYRLRFVCELRTFNPNDPMVAVRVRERLAPDPARVIAVSDGYEIQRGWIRSTRRYYDGQPMRGRQIVLRSDGHVQDIDMSRARMMLFDGKSGRWGPVVPATYRLGRFASWENEPWILYPGEPAPMSEGGAAIHGKGNPAMAQNPAG